MATEIWLNIGWGNGLLPDGIKPSPEPILTSHQWGLVAFTYHGQSHRKCPRYLSLIWKLLVHWDRVTLICVSKLTIISSNNCLSPCRQVFIWIRTLGTNFSEIFSNIHTFSFEKMHLKMSSAKWWQCCLGLNVLIQVIITWLRGFLEWNCCGCPWRRDE